MRPVFLLIFVLSVSGCSTLPDGPVWGKNATFAPGWARVGDAAVDAARSPVTWAPLATAGLLQIGDADRHISHSISDHTPIFGSQDTAQSASNALLGASIGLYAVTAVAAPSGDDHWRWNKAKGLSVGLGAALATEGAVQGLKLGVDRQRPDDSGHDSFPSGHAALATLSATMADRNIDTLPISDTRQFALKGLAAGLSVGTDYARVASRQHFPSDVLVGVAIGHFIGVVADEAFLGVAPDRFAPSVDISRHGATVGFQASFN